MLRITVHDRPGALAFQLEGRLAGPWVRVLEESWRSVLARLRQPTIRVDLTGVTCIDAAGKACLTSLHRQGAEFLAADCLTKDVVAEIQGSEVRGQRSDVTPGRKRRRGLTHGGALDIEDDTYEQHP
jgi:hypothetical protein